MKTGEGETEIENLRFVFISRAVVKGLNSKKELLVLRYTWKKSTWFGGCITLKRKRAGERAGQKAHKLF